MWQSGWRDQVWSELDRPWDVIVIGGGITGAGILQEAVQAGLRTILIEKDDFASGTSSRSSKLVHGGLRYLRNGQLRTTLASVHERERLLNEGKGLINPLSFLYACYDGDNAPLWLLGLGLTVYDLLGLRWGHKRYNSEGMARLAPHLNQEGLKGGYRYFDAQTDDARLVIRVIRDAVRAGGMALNYTKADRLLFRRSGQVIGVAVSDSSGLSSRSAELVGSTVINAAGASADSFRNQLGSESRLRRLRGSHLIFPASHFPLQRAVSFAHPVDGRPIFAIPWEGVTLFGTTDIDHPLPPDLEPAINSDELDYLMVAVRQGFPDLSLAEKNVQSTMAGIRAVINTGKADPSKESREHALWLEEGLLTVTGGKLTTFRVMARDALRYLRKNKQIRTQIGNHRIFDDISADMTSFSSIEPAIRQRLAGHFGREAIDLAHDARPEELSPVCEIVNNRVTWAELRWSARMEGVVHLGDLMLRRLRLGLLLPNGGQAQMEEIRAIVQPELGWSDERWKREEAEYLQNWFCYYSLPS